MCSARVVRSLPQEGQSQLIRTGFRPDSGPASGVRTAPAALPRQEPTGQLLAPGDPIQQVEDHSNQFAYQLHRAGSVLQLLSSPTSAPWLSKSAACSSNPTGSVIVTIAVGRKPSGLLIKPSRPAYQLLRSWVANQDACLSTSAPWATSREACLSTSAPWAVDPGSSTWMKTRFS